ncbi:MAG TPA: MFS transporter [Cellulomonas sp.]
MSTRRTPARPAVLLTAVFATQFLVSMDMALLNIALPEISLALDFPDTLLPWVVNAYLLTFAGFMLLGGRIGDLWGRRVVLTAGLIGFGLFSLWGGFAQTPTTLVLARAGQGISGALLSPAVLALAATGLPDDRLRSRALGLWGAAGAAGGALGVVLSGILTEHLGWRSVLFVNLPIVLVCLVAVRLGVPGSRTEGAAGRLDVAGALLVTTGVGALAAAVGFAGTDGWGSRPALVGFAAAVVLLAAFVLVEARSPHPLMPLGLLRARSIVGANVFGFLLAAGQLASFYFASLYVQQVWGVRPGAAGAMFLPFSVLVVVGIQLAGRCTARWGARITLAVFGTVGAASLGWFSLMTPDGTFLTEVLGPSVLGGIGIGGAMLLVGKVGTAGVATQDAGAASGVLNSSRQLGGTIGLAVLVTIAAQVTTEHGGSTAEALGAGYTAGFAVAAGLLLLGVVAVLAIVPRTVATASTPA